MVDSGSAPAEGVVAAEAEVLAPTVGEPAGPAQVMLKSNHQCSAIDAPAPVIRAKASRVALLRRIEVVAGSSAAVSGPDAVAAASASSCVGTEAAPPASLRLLVASQSRVGVENADECGFCFCFSCKKEL